MCGKCTETAARGGDFRLACDGLSLALSASAAVGVGRHGAVGFGSSRATSPNCGRNPGDEWLDAFAGSDARGVGSIRGMSFRLAWRFPLSCAA